MSMEKRIDIALVERGLCKSRSRAKSLLKEGLVLCNDVVCTKPSLMVSDTDVLTLLGQFPYVGRGGLKLEEALRQFPVTVSGKNCMDVGASTGGFTDCMLQNGAQKVYAIDVGHEQLDKTLRNDLRVVNLEDTDVRLLLPEEINERIDFCSVDVSFISLTLILPSVHRLLSETAECIVLIKPQFEAGRSNIGKKGIVKSAAVHCEVLDRVLAFAKEVGFSVQGLCPSPILGGSGNAEYLAFLVKDRTKDNAVIDIKAVVRSAGVNG